MNLPIFTQSPSCTSFAHCGVCRDREGGRSFRQSLARAFAMPDDAPDFACPHGKRWGATAEPTPPPKAENGGPGDLVKAILARLGIKPRKKCGCEAMRRRMNQWGYVGCWQHRAEIRAWFKAKAAEAGIAIDFRTVWGWIIAGGRE